MGRYFGHVVLPSPDIAIMLHIHSSCDTQRHSVTQCEIIAGI